MDVVYQFLFGILNARHVVLKAKWQHGTVRKSSLACWRLPASKSFNRSSNLGEWGKKNYETQSVCN